MKIEMRKLSDVKPYEQNPRINNAAVDSVAASIKEFGFRQPLVVDKVGVIIIGHTRWKAAQKLGLEKVPVHVADLPLEKARALRIADNKLHELSEWDFELLPLELKDLQSADFDINLLGFGSEELEKLLGADYHGNPGLTDPDAVPEPPDEPISRPGDLWILGNHRLLCGDSSKPEDLDRLLDGAKIQLAQNDPPYNVRVESRSNNAIAAGLSSFGSAADVADADARGMHHQGFDLARDKSKSVPTTRKLRPKDRPLANDFVSEDEFDRLLRAWFGNIARVLEPGRAFYIWGGYANLANYPFALKECELYFSQAIVWDKLWPVLGRKDFLSCFEIAFYGWREGAAHYFNPEIKNAPDLWHVKKVTPQYMVHLTEKPVELAVMAMTYSSKPGENVLDLFGGSGSTLIAAERTGRRAFLLELDALYCDVICDRWAQYTGKEVLRVDSEGKTTARSELVRASRSATSA